MQTVKIFELNTLLSKSFWQAQPVSLAKLQTEPGIHGQQKLIVGNYAEIKFPVEFRQTYGEKLGDIVDTGWPWLYLFSEKIISLLTQEKIVGWKTFPINLIDKNGVEIFGYYGFSVTNTCGQINSNPHQGTSAPVWDDFDFAHPSDAYTIFVSDRVKNLFITNDISNVRFIPLGEILT